MFTVIEFSESDGGGLAVVNSSWITPRKKEVFWPPTKDPSQFYKIVREVNQAVNSQTWATYEIGRIFYECDDYEKARKKLKQAEETSDLNTDTENNQNRKRIPAKRILDSSSDEEPLSKFERPPKIKLNFSKKNIGKSEALQNNRPGPSIIDEVIVSNSKRPTTPTTSKPNLGFPAEVTNRGFDQQVLPRILEKLVRIEVQNEQILNLLQSRRDNTQEPKVITSMPQLPFELPVQSAAEIQEIEEYFSNENNFQLMSTYLVSLGGNNITSRTNRILRQLVADSVASSYSFLGRKKRDFHILQLSKLIISSVKVAVPESTEKEIEDAIKIWLKHAPARLNKKQGMSRK